MIPRNKSILVAVSVLAFAARTASAGLIDFEAYPSDHFIDGLNLGGVTLTNPYAQHVTVYDNEYGIGYHSATKAFSSNDFMRFESVRLAAVFDSPQSFVRLWGGNEGLGYVYGWLLEAFDAPVGGNSLGLVQTGPWVGAPYLPLEITAPHIMRIEFGLQNQNLGSGMGFDDLEFSPEPAGVFALVAGVMLFRSRRRTVRHAS
jgi:hypothetical protein